MTKKPDPKKDLNSSEKQIKVINYILFENIFVKKAEEVPPLAF